MLVVIRGAGDIATGIALRLYRAGMQVVMCDLAQPTSIRRTVCFSEAIRLGETTIEGVRGVLCEDAEGHNQTLRADAVICAMGGNAGPQFGTDGFGTRFAAQCGGKLEPLYPCLTALQTARPNKALAGIRVKARAALLDLDRHTLPDAAWQVLANTAKHWLFEDLTPCGWKQAQTTGGGLSLTELEPSFQFKGCPGLYFVGETLDCAGSCGGFNLHWAFGSGLAAGRDAANRKR